MCRLCAITSSAPIETKQTLFHIAMLTGSFSEDQFDGHGYTDGETLIKSKTAYPFAVPRLGSLKADKLWVGHVRRASPHTEISDDASHPYHFKSGERDLFFAHNGFFPGATTNLVPKTDTFGALTELLAIEADPFHSDGSVDVPAIKLWLSKYYSTMAFAVMIHNGEFLHIIRNKDRGLFYMTWNGGLFIHTLPQVMHHMKLFIHESGGALGEVTAFAEDTLYTAQMNREEFVTIEKIEYKYTFQEANKYNQPVSSSYPKVIRPTTETKQLPLMEDREEKRGALLRAQKLITETNGELEPLRAPMIGFWFSTLFQRLDTNGKIFNQNLLTYLHLLNEEDAIADLVTFKDAAFSYIYNDEDGLFKKDNKAEQRFEDVVKTWNERVPRETEAHVQFIMLGYLPFFMVYDSAFQLEIDVSMIQSEILRQHHDVATIGKNYREKLALRHPEFKHYFMSWSKEVKKCI